MEGCVSRNCGLFVGEAHDKFIEVGKIGCAGGGVIGGVVGRDEGGRMQIGRVDEGELRAATRQQLRCFVDF